MREPDTAYQLETYELLAKHYCAEAGIDARFLDRDFDLQVQEMCNELMFTMNAKFATKSISSKVKIPRSWLDLLIVQRFPKWLKKYFTVNYLLLEVEETALFPGVNIPREAEYFRIVEMSDSNPYKL